MSIKQDLENRISVIEDLEQQILQEPVRYYRLKKSNELLSARHNLRMQFYTEHITDSEILEMLENEAKNFVLFQATLTTRFGKSNSEFASNLQSVLDTCEQSKFLNSKDIISIAQETLGYISLTTRQSKNIMKKYRLRQLQKCKTILSQYSQENIENKARSLDCCTGLNKDELGE
ncbi:MAG: hypothetical protein E7356_02775 [Clostridiales bacterium]|nr:hypothetical protein [Clostridiales bacterium]